MISEQQMHFAQIAPRKSMVLMWTQEHFVVCTCTAVLVKKLAR